MTVPSSTPMAPVLVDSSPQPSASDLALEAVQWMIGVIGVCGVTLPPAVTNLQTEQMLAGALLSLGSLAMGAYRKWHATQKQHASAVASAQMGRPVRVVS
jgi:hypothetical protein